MCTINGKHYDDEIKTLNLYCHQLSTLPPEIGKLTALQGLNLCGNQLTTIPSQMIGKLTALRGLHLGGNPLKIIPKVLIARWFPSEKEVLAVDIRPSYYFSLLPRDMLFGHLQKFLQKDTNIMYI